MSDRDTATMRARNEDPTGIRHYPGCKWFCGVQHGTTWRDYECCCIEPSPARGERDRCQACNAAIPIERQPKRRQH